MRGFGNSSSVSSTAKIARSSISPASSSARPESIPAQLVGCQSQETEILHGRVYSASASQRSRWASSIPQQSAFKAEVAAKALSSRGLSRNRDVRAAIVRRSSNDRPDCRPRIRLRGPGYVLGCFRTAMPALPQELGARQRRLTSSAAPGQGARVPVLTKPPAGSEIRRCRRSEQLAHDCARHKLVLTLAKPFVHSQGNCWCLRLE